MTSDRNRRSRFNETVPLLAAWTGLPLFVEMKETGIARPMVKAIRKDVLPRVPAGYRGRARRALGILCRSKRYLKAVLEPGAQYHNADGEPMGFVTEDHRRYAEMFLAQHRPHGKPVRP